MFLDEAGKIRWSAVAIALGIVGALGMIAYAIYSDGKDVRMLAEGAAKAVNDAAGAAKTAGESAVAQVAEAAKSATNAVASAVASAAKTTVATVPA